MKARGFVGRLRVLAPLLVALAALALPAAEVPLTRFTNASFPQGFEIGYSMGVSWGDYDADGYPDLFACYSGQLWRNVNGTTWQFAAALGDSVLPATERRYGSTFGDYDRDGRPDIATASRTPAWGDDRSHLLHNLGGGANFADVAGDPSIVDVQPYGNNETLCWADVDGDRRLDLFVPVYPGTLGPGNFFLHNLGPVGPGGAYAFAEASADVGLDNAPGHDRPEGAQFVDVDGDGDLDLYSNTTIYQNRSGFGSPSFVALDPAASGITETTLDEGSMLFDYDLDGDMDLAVAYTYAGVKIWENRGDGTFFELEPGAIDSPMTGNDLGMSAEDWDNDGDIDFTTRSVFRQNMLVEQGARKFIVAGTTNIPLTDRNSATPAWADWDKDGDLDCALGNWGSVAHLYQNTTYGPGTPFASRRHLRVRPVANSQTVTRGLETEYGTTVEIRPRNVVGPYVRKKFVASSAGWINQNEYTLHFALPPDPAPGNPAEDVRFDVMATFPDLASSGLWRVDPHVNPALGNVNLAALDDREITVYRCGQAVINGVKYAPIAGLPRSLATVPELMEPDAADPLPDLTQAPTNGYYVGLAFDTIGDPFGPLRIEEIVLDGQFDDPVACSSVQTNLSLWDVTDAAHPALVTNGNVLGRTSSRNRRSHLPVDLVVSPNRSYRVVARVIAFRPTPIAAPLANGTITVRGGLAFPDGVPCAGTGVAQAPLDPTRAALSLRFRPTQPVSDPVGSTLRLTRGFRGAPVLKWQGLPTNEYQVLRCNARSGPCVPTLFTKESESTYIDGYATAPQRENFWYLVKGVDECAGF